MKETLRYLLFLLTLLLSVPALAQEPADEPMLTIWTNRYALYGADNSLQISMTALASVGSTNVEVDFGYGRRKVAVASDGNLSEDGENEVVTGGSVISGSVSPEGVVRVYGNAQDIDYLDCHGSNIYAIDIHRMTNLAILECGHNELKSLSTEGLTYLEYLDVKDNPFTEGLTLGSHSYLKYLNLNQLGDHALDGIGGRLDLSAYPALHIFMAWDSHCLRSVNSSGCKNLVQLSIDNTGVTSLDLSGNPYLQILNIADCGFNTIDLSNNPYLVELYADNQGQESVSRKLQALDLSNNTYLQRIYCSGNNLKTLDISKQWNLVSLEAHHNHLSRIDGIDMSLPEGQRPDSLAYLGLMYNDFTFATLPFVDPRTEFEYSDQHELPVAKEYGACEAGRLDLSQYVLRDGTSTAVAMAGLSRDGFSYDYQLMDGIDFNFDPESGIITFLKPQNDSIQVACFNDYFNGVVLLTSKFVVRSAEDYGKPVEKFSAVRIATEEVISTQGRLYVTTREDETLYVDFGNGQQVPFVTTAYTPAAISGELTGALRVYGRVGASFEDITITDLPLSSLDVSRLSDLRSLSVTGCSLHEIDLGWNNELVSLDLSNNMLSALDLNGENNAFNKNILSHVNVSHNRLTSFNPGVAAVTIHDMDCSHNLLSEINLRTMETLQQLNASHNLLTVLRLDDCKALRSLDVSGNELVSIDYSACPELSALDLRGNDYTFATLPEPKPGFLLAPQQQVRIAARAMSVDLTSEAVVHGSKTVYTWRRVGDGSALAEGSDYTISGGKTVFAESVVGQTLYCEMQNALYPDFVGDNVLRTTEITATGMPQYCIASFTTPVGGEKAMLSLAATEPDTYIYIDWGDGDLREYPLQTMYTLFEDDHTIAGADVHIYSNVAPHGNMYVFSVDSITMQNIDVRAMSELYCLNISHAGISDIDLSGNLKLGELILEGNRFSTIDLSAHKGLNMVVLASNELTDIKLAKGNHIAWFGASYNRLSDFDWQSLSSVYSLDLAGNDISAIDMSKLPDLGQLFIAQNRLHEIDLSGHPNLFVLDIATNCFDFSTLPYPSIPVYRYGNQQPLEVECIDGRIDLSSQLSAYDSASNIYFFEGEISITVDDNGNAVLLNREYEEGTDFFNAEGVISFAAPHDAVTGLVVNELFPDLLLYTKTIAVTADPQYDGISEVNAPAASRHMYNVNGQRVTSARGLVIKDGRAYMVK